MIQARLNMAPYESLDDPAVEKDYFKQYDGILPMPIPNLYGVCNNYAPARFMESLSNECS